MNPTIEQFTLLRLFSATPRQFRQSTRRQQIAALSVLAAALILALWLWSTGTELPATSGWTVSGFAAAYGIAMLLSVRTPQGITLAMVSANVVALSMSLPPQIAILIPLGTAVLLIPIGWIATRFAIKLPTEPLYMGSINGLIMAGGSLLWRQFSGGVPVDLFTLPYLLYFLAYAHGIILLLLAAARLWIGLGDYQRSPVRGETQFLYLASNYLPTLFAPMLAIHPHEGSAVLSWLITSVGATIFLYVFNNNTLDLNHRIATERILNSVGTALSAYLNLEDLVAAMRAEIGKLMDVSGFYLALFDANTNLLSFPLSYRRGLPEILPEREFTLNRFTETIISTRKPLLTVTGPQDTLPYSGDTNPDDQPLSFVGVPVIAGPEVIGVIALRDYDHEHAFVQKDVDLLQSISAQVAVAINNACHYTRIRRSLSLRLEEIAAFERIAQRLTSRLELEDVINLLVQIAAEATGAEVSIIGLLDELGNELRIAAQAGKVLLDTWHWPAGQGLAAKALRNGTPVLVNDVEKDPEYRKAISTTRSELITPIILNGRRLGVLNLESTRLNAFTADHMRFISNLAEYAAIAINNAQLYRSEHDQRVAAEILLETSGAFSSLRDPDKVMQMLAAQLLEVSGYNLFNYYAADESGSSLIRHAEVAECQWLDSRPDRLEKAAYPVGWEVLSSQQPRSLKAGMAEFDAEEAWLANMGIQSVLLLPLKAAGKVIGLVEIGSLQPDTFDSASHLLAACQRILEQAEESLKPGMRSSSAGKLDSLASNLIKESAAQSCTLLMLNPAGDALQTVLHRSALLWPESESHRVPDHLLPVFDRVLKQNTPLIHPNLPPADPRNRWHWRKWVSLPVMLNGQGIGIADLVSLSEVPDPSPSDLRLWRAILDHAVVALDNARLTSQIRTNLNRLEAILNSSTDGLIMVNTNDTVVLANPRAEYLLNVHMKNMQGKHIREVMRRMTDFPDGQLRRQAWEEALQVQKSAAKDPTAITRRQYTYSSPYLRAIEEISAGVFDEHGKPAGRLFVFHDVTHQVEIQNYREELSNMLVHDLRSPLSSVITSLHIIKEYMGVTPDQRDEVSLQAAARVALTNSTNLLELIETLLEISKLETRQLPLDLREISLKKLAQQAITKLKPAADQASIDIALKAPAKLPPVLVDFEKIERVLVNLIDNALRYTPVEGHITIEIQNAITHQQVTVTDTGPGIEPAMRERIFERFVQANQTGRARGGKGTGLGLTFSRLAVEAHQGRIWVDQNYAQGTQIHFILPAIHSST
jgi:signal transduction histidine kinase/transcriptional regulator with GAF, ATPase, and Fis domain